MMRRGIEFKEELERVDMTSGASIKRYAVHLEGMTFRDILNLRIVPEGEDGTKTYSGAGYKGGMGNLIEERYFGYKANSDERPDFAEAGVELKATCYDIKKNGEKSAGERLVITMIPYDREVTTDFYESHLWTKCRSILLIYYHRDRTLKGEQKLDQRISYVDLFTPPEKDLEIIRDDYKKIVSYLQAGRADELSEGLTTYLGAATKGTTAEKSWVVQYYPRVFEDGTEERRKAKKRAFSFKRQYMDYVLHEYMMGRREDAESVLGEGGLEGETFDQHIEGLLRPYIGLSDRQIAERLSVTYTGNKAQWYTLVYHMLGIQGNRAEEFLKAGISVRTVRVEANGKIKEHLSFSTFEFCEVGEGEWEDSELREYLEATRFFFVVFRKRDGAYELAGSLFWSMPVRDIEGAAHECWLRTRETIRRGVKLCRKGSRVMNDLPGPSDNPVMHVRPKASHAAYRFADGSEQGDVQKDASMLPDGRCMTRQAFWINSSYLEEVLNQFRDSEGREAR